MAKKNEETVEEVEMAEEVVIEEEDLAGEEYLLSIQHPGDHRS